MSDEFSSERFSTSEDLLRRLQEKSDDFESIKLMVTNDMPLMGPNGEKRLAKDCCAIIKTCNGQSILIHRDEFEALLNDGILQRLKIPVSLIPREDRPS
jgi:hypothetical protein